MPTIRSAVIEIDALLGQARLPSDPDRSATRAPAPWTSPPRSRPVTALPEYGPAVDVEHLTVDPLPVVRCQERHHGRDVLGRS